MADIPDLSVDKTSRFPGPGLLSNSDAGDMQDWPVALRAAHTDGLDLKKQTTAWWEQKGSGLSCRPTQSRSSPGGIDVPEASASEASPWPESRARKAKLHVSQDRHGPQTEEGQGAGSELGMRRGDNLIWKKLISQNGSGRAKGPRITEKQF
ncbi:protein LBH isoform X1 [Panthera leo]|uniref:protein LBH isoform X1 n=1 Tax=Panthera leo TaxID=9689 RepID=UPI001C6A36C8|nr:protein LBH isoform X1 [Panthera leo]XP_042789264.1 protein LBH isoform X1 [Panthera leo]